MLISAISYPVSRFLFADGRLYGFFSTSSALGTAVNHAQLQERIRSHSGHLTRQTAVPLRWLLPSRGSMVGCISFTVWVSSVNWRAMAGFCLKGVIQQKHCRPPITFHWESQRTWERTRTSAVSGIGGDNLNYGTMYSWGGHVATWRTSLWETREESWSSTLALLITLSEVLQVFLSPFFLL